MPMASALVFAAALSLTLQFLIFVYLYSFHRARFFHYLLLAWGLMSLCKGLYLARAFVPSLDVLSALVSATSFVATLLVLAGGLAFRTDYRIGRRDLLIGVLAGFAAAGIGDLSDASVAARGFVGVVTGGVLIAAGLQFWPRRAQALGYRGPRFLAVALTLWGLHRMVSPFIEGPEYRAARDDARRLHGLLLPLHLCDHHRGAGPGPQRDRDAQGIQRAPGGRPRRGPPAR